MGSFPAERRSAPPAEASGRWSATADAAYGRLPLHFEENRGQADPEVRFLARGRGYGVFLTAGEAVLVLGRGAHPPTVLRTRLVGADPPLVAGREPLPGRSHYVVGRDPARWRTDIPQFARVECRDVYPGVNLTYRGRQRELEYDFVVRPGGDPRSIRLRVEGAKIVRIDGEGNLVLAAGEAELTERAPVIYQEEEGARKSVPGRYTLAENGEVGFEVGAYDAGRELVIDPVLSYSTYLGGSGDEQGHAIAVDSAGSAHLTGWVSSTDFPTRNPLQPARAGGKDVFVAKLDAAGTALVYSTYLGGRETTPAPASPSTPWATPT